MRYFLIGLALVHGVAVGVVVASMTQLIRTSVWWDNGGSVQAAIVLAGVLPFAASFLGADLLDRLRPRAIFDHRAPRRVRALIAGLSTGVLGVLLGAVGVMLAEHLVHEGVLFATGSLLAPIVVHLFLAPRRRPGSCLRCGYDLAGTSMTCPECGASASRA